MVFSSIPFIFFFLPLFFILYYLCPVKLKNRVILIFSLIFYAWGEIKCLPLMLFVALVDYTHARVSASLGLTGMRKKLALAAAIVIDLGLLGYFKYADFLVGIYKGITGSGVAMPGVALPVGISFFTFQSMSYSIDFYRGEILPERSYADYLTYVSMFPQLVAGPIVRYADIRERLHKRVVTWDDFCSALMRFLMGLYKKVLLANQLGKLWDEALYMGGGRGAYSGVSPGFAWLGALCFTLQLYFDFSAYSDMAIGMGRMMGFDFPENFRYPLSAVSITDFWRRWHISLSTWFRDYVYIPLGGNRVGVIRHLRNMLVVWFLTGLWHGASWNFVLWGLWHGLFLALEKYVWGDFIRKLPALLQHIYTLFLVVTGFVIFAIDDMGSLSAYLSGMFFGGLQKGLPMVGSELLWYGGNYLTVIITGCVLAFPVYERLKAAVEGESRFPHIAEGNGEVLCSAAVGNAGIDAECGNYNTDTCGGNAGTVERALFVIKPVAAVALFVLSVAFLISDSYNPFLYFRF